MPTTTPRERMATVQLRGGDLVRRLPDLFGDFDRRFNSAPAEVRFSVAGITFHCRAVDAHYCNIAAPVLPVARGGVADVLILVDQQDNDPPPPWPRWTDAHFHERDVEATLAATPFRLHFHDQTGFWQVFNRDRALGLQLMRDAQGYPAWDPGSPLRNMIHWALAERGGGLVHAGVLGTGGRGLLLAGTGGSGKSGTVIAGLLNGLDSVGDDYVAITLNGGIRAHRAFNSLKQDPAGFARLGLAARLGAKGALNWQGKHLFTFAQLGLAAPPDQMAIAALCLPQIGGGNQTTFDSISPREAFLALAPSGVSQIPCARPETFRLCATLARDLPAYRVRLGTDPAEIATAFARFLARALP